jgi:hydroxymethylpyrimidine pyrophosphatase-like HAD family hydrolase
MGEIRLVASDLDGTLLRPDETVSERTREAIMAVRRAGITLVLVTGRPPRALAPIAARIGVGGIAICANGAVVWDLDAGTMVDVTPLAADLAAGLVRELREAIPGVLFAVELEHGFGREAGWTDGTGPPRPRLVERETPEVLEADALEMVTGPVVKLLVRHPTLPFPEVARRARQAVGEQAVVTWAGTRLLEISAAGVTKAWALERLCARLGVRRQEVLALGDMENDLPMLAWAGHSVAVANAQPDVLDAADEVTASNLDDGVALVLERLAAEPTARPRPAGPEPGD